MSEEQKVKVYDKKGRVHFLSKLNAIDAINHNGCVEAEVYEGVKADATIQAREEGRREAEALQEEKDKKADEARLAAEKESKSPKQGLKSSQSQAESKVAESKK